MHQPKDESTSPEPREQKLNHKNSDRQPHSRQVVFNVCTSASSIRTQFLFRGAQNLFWVA